MSRLAIMQVVMRNTMSTLSHKVLSTFTANNTHCTSTIHIYPLTKYIHILLTLFDIKTESQFYKHCIILTTGPYLLLIQSLNVFF